jgi:hypothetical protein
LKQFLLREAIMMSHRARTSLRWCLLALGGLALVSAVSAPARPAGRAAEPDPEPRTPWPKTTRAHRAQSANNLKQIAIAMISFADTNLSVPAAAIVDRKGKALLSWRVAILPYIGEAALYREFKLDEPWDSKHNKKLLARMPKLYAPTISGKPAKPNTTYYQVFTGADTPFDPNTIGGVPPLCLGARFPAGFPDGTSNTVLVAEGKDPVPWTKPDDLPYDAKKKLPKLGGLFKEGFHVAMADGSAMFIARKVDAKTLRALITPAGGEVIDRDKVPLARPPAGKK